MAGSSSFEAVKRHKSSSSHDRCLHLSSLGRPKFITQSGVTNLLKTIREDGLPEASSRPAQYRARKALCQTVTPFGKLVTYSPAEFRAGTDEITFQNPLAFLAYHCSESPDYAQIVARAFRKHPCTPVHPWRLIVYQDGVNPSDGLAKNHSRKSVVFYWAFAEFGMRALAHEEVWGTVVVVRTFHTKRLVGQVVQLTSRVLDQFFGGEHDIGISGARVKMHSAADIDVVHIFAALGVLLADEPALKEMVDCKGHAGNICCPICTNASLVNTSHGGIPLHLTSDFAVPITEPRMARFTQHTDASLRRVMERLQHLHAEVTAGRMRQDAYDERSMVLGYNWSPYNIILNHRFNIASSIMFDWAHTYVCEGLADVEFGMCMKELHSKRTPSSLEECANYVGTFTFPKAAPDVGHLFSETNNKNNYRKGTFSSNASEFLTLAPILKRYMENVVAGRGACMAFVTSCIAVLLVVELLQAIKACDLSPDELEAAIFRHFEMFLIAYGAAHVRPKHHYAIHLPAMLRKFGFLLSTFTHERKHKTVKKYTQGRRNLTSWDEGVVEDVTCHQIWEMSLPFFLQDSTSRPRGTILQSLREMFPMVPDERLTLHRSVSCNGGSCSPGDVISFRDGDAPRVGELLCIVGVERVGTHSLFAIVCVWERGAMESRNWLTFQVSDSDVRQVDGQCVDTVLTYRMASDRSSCVVYLPYELRG